MNTKYNSVDGCSKNNIRKTYKKRKCSNKNVKLTTLQKTLRFSKRASVLVAKFTSKKLKALTLKLKAVKKQSKGKVITVRTPIKRKAASAIITGVLAATLTCATAASAIGINPADLPKSENIGLKFADNTARADELFSNGIASTSCSGLYVDGELIGVTGDAKQLDNALNQILVDYRKKYDSTTTTYFANDVKIKPVNYDLQDVEEVSVIIEKATDKLSIGLDTDITYTEGIECGVDVEYDDSQYTTYEKTKSNGKNGTQLVTYRTTFVDGKQTDAVIINTKVINEPVNKVVVRGTIETVTTGTFIWPLPYSHAISSYFEYRWGSFHQGIDIADSGIYGEDIVASDGGTVEYAGDDGSGYGYYVIIDHNNGYKTLYGHCCELAVSTGETVEQGQTIGYVGSTGYSTGPHLHFEIMENGEHINPLNFVE